MLTRGILVALPLVVVMGCYDPPSGVCGIVCTDRCPGDMTCTNGRCMPDDPTSCAAPPIDFATIGVGARHACGLDLGGTVYCWGDNEDDQLGGFVGRIAPSPVAIARHWKALAVGGEHTCALDAELPGGAPYCWGENDQGQATARAGANTVVPTPVPFGPTLVPEFDQIAAGGSHSCALGEGQLWCWGNRSDIGTGEISINVAMQIGTLTDWIAISLGRQHSCGISASMGVLCWGRNNAGEAGSPAGVTIGTPTQVAGLPAGTPLVVAAGDGNTCAVIATTGGTTGELWCWGYAQLIDEMGNQLRAPVQMGTEAAWTNVSVGEGLACATLGAKTYCWGEGYDGSLGNGIWQDRRGFATAFELGVVDQVAFGINYAGRRNRIACLRDGTEVRCWGDNDYGTLGLGMVSWYPTPVEVTAPDGSAWAQVRSGGEHSCATTTDGAVWCWGANDRGQVEIATPRGLTAACTTDVPCDYPRPEPAPAPIATAEDLVVGDDYTCVRDGGTARCWGRSSRGNLGIPNPAGAGVSSVTPPGGQFTKIFGGHRATCGVDAVGKLACWGMVAGPQQDTPQPVPNDAELTNVTGIAFGDEFGCATRSTDDARVCWGANFEGQLGDGGTGAVVTPVALPAPPVAELSARGAGACAVTRPGGIACWGRSDYGRAGQPSGSVFTPSPILDTTDAPLGACASVATATTHACAICGGRPMCWGRGYDAELGQGTTDLGDKMRAVAVAVPAELSFVSVAALIHGGCALSDAGRLFCWGRSQRGEVGAGGSARNVPTPVGTVPP